MEIVFHAHHAVISDELRARAERAVHKAAARLRRAVDATVRFEEDGPTRRVEIVLHAPRARPVVAIGEDRMLARALTAAAARLQAQVDRGASARVRSRRTPDGAGAVALDDREPAEAEPAEAEIDDAPAATLPPAAP